MDFNPRPLTGATQVAKGFKGEPFNFNPRPLTGATGLYHVFNDNVFIISIHAPSRGRPVGPETGFRAGLFQSTPPHGGDRDYGPRCRCCAISIHAPSRGRLHLVTISLHDGFISIHAPSRGRQHAAVLCFGVHYISIHAPSRGRRLVHSHGSGQQLFQSTPPHGGDRIRSSPVSALTNFNPRPLTGATRPWPPWCPWMLISIHAPSRGRLDQGRCTV